MCLLYLLSEVKRENENGFPALYAAHLHHGLRAKEADEDQLLVKEYAEKLDIPFFTRCVDIKKDSQNQKIGIEEAGRKARYSFFSELLESLSKKHASIYIATGHHKEDQAETILMNLFRGAGMDGLSGMRPKSENRIKPLLFSNKKDLHRLSKEKAIPFSEDRTNKSDEYTRNQWRNAVIPLLDEIVSGSPVDKLCDTAELLSKDRDFLEEEAKKLSEKWLQADENGRFFMDSKVLSGFSFSMSSRLVRQLYFFSLGSRRDLEHHHVTDILRLSENGTSGARIHLPHQKLAYIQDGKLFIGTEDDFIEKGAKIFWRKGKNLLLAGDKVEPISLKDLLKCEQNTKHIADTSFYINILRVENKERLVYNNEMWHMKEDMLSGVVLRTKQKDDTFQRAGQKGKKKLRRLFTDWKLPESIRNRVLLFAKGSEVLWIPGIGHAEGFTDALSEGKWLAEYSQGEWKDMYRIFITKGRGEKRMSQYIKDTLIPKEKIAEVVERMAKQISADYKGQEIVAIGVLKGSFIFLSDLVRKLDIPVHIDFMSVSSYYGGTKSSGVVKIIKDVDIDISNRHVLIVEDIIDSGLTLQHLKDLLLTRSPASLKICAAFDKPDRRQVQIDVDYVGMQIPDEFIIGYGLDFDGKYRNLPDVCILANEGGNE